MQRRNVLSDKVGAHRSSGVDSNSGLSRTERVGHAWRVRDDALWNPFEVIAFLVNIVFFFGFILGHSHYLFVFQLFLPVVLLSSIVIIYQTVMRRRAGENGPIRHLIERIR